MLHSLNDTYTHRGVRDNRRQDMKRQRRRYFFKQRFYGAALVLITIPMIMLEGDATIGLFTVPTGLYLILSKEMCITDTFYYQSRGKNND